MTALEAVGYIMSSREGGKGRETERDEVGRREGGDAGAQLSFPFVQVSILGVSNPNLETSS